MQAGFLAEWTSAPFAIEAGAVILAVVGVFSLGCGRDGSHDLHSRVGLLS